MPIIPTSDRATTILEACVSEVSARARSAAEGQLQSALLGCKTEAEVVLLANLWAASPPGIPFAGERIRHFEGGNFVLTHSGRHAYGIDGLNFTTKIPHRLKKMTLLSRGLLILPQLEIGPALIDVLLYQYSDQGVPFKARWVGVAIGPAVKRSDAASDQDGEADLEAWLIEKKVPLMQMNEHDISENPEVCVETILRKLSDLPFR